MHACNTTLTSTPRRQSPGLFHDTLEAWLLEYGFAPIGADGVIFKLTRGGKQIILSLYVDDGLCATDSPELYAEFLADLRKRFDLSDQGELNWYLGVAINHDLKAGVTTLSQEMFVNTLLTRFNLEGINPKLTPAEPNTHLLRSDQPVHPDKEMVRLYQQKVGSLMYLACFTRPDIAYAVNQCAKFMSNPGPTHMQAANRILDNIIWHAFTCHARLQCTTRRVILKRVCTICASYAVKGR